MFHRLIGALIALLVSATSWSAPCASDQLDRLVPHADGPAMFREETVHARKYIPAQKMADRGFDHVVGMWNAVTAHPCDRGRPAVIEFRRFEVVRLDKASGKLVPELTLTFDGTSAFGGGGQWKRLPEWFISGQPERQPTVASMKGGVFRVDLKSIPENILHMWTDRIKAAPGHIYGVRMQVRITGDARLQPAMDFWRGAGSEWTGWSPDCVKPTLDKGVAPNNCEAFLGDWIGDTKGEFITVVSPRTLLGSAL
jgi:hypothetical protein